MSSILPFSSLILILTALLSGCEDRKSDTASADSVAALDSATMTESNEDAASTSSAASDAPQSDDDSSGPLTAKDIDRWEKGMAAEMQMVQEAAAKVTAARSVEDKVKLMAEADESGTAPAGARAAGLDEARYSFVRSTLSEAVTQVAPLPAKADSNVRSYYAQQQADYLKTIETTMPPAVVEALRARASELRRKDSALSSTRLKVAGFQ